MAVVSAPRRADAPSMAGGRSLQCIECGIASDETALGWAGYRCDDPELDEPPALAFYCPTCALAEFGV
jgi:hypothetical protein